MYAKTIGIIPRSDGVSMEDSLKNFLKARGVNEENMLHLEDEKVSMISKYNDQSGRSPKVVALFSATNFSSYIIELLQLHDTIQIIWNYAWNHYNVTIRSHLMI